TTRRHASSEATYAVRRLMAPAGIDGGDEAVPKASRPKSSSQVPLCWREMDSNFRFRAKLGLRRGRRLALHLGSVHAPAVRPRLERDQAAPGFGEEGEHCRRVINRRATASKARPELGALLGLKAVRFGASNAVL